MDALGMMSEIQNVMDRWMVEEITNEEALALIQEILSLNDA